jgi:hypothetical protein
MPLAALAILEGLLHLAFLHVLKPSVFVLVFKLGILELVFGANHKNLPFHDVINSDLQLMSVYFLRENYFLGDT